MISVLIVDDKPMLAASMRQTLEDAGGFEIAGLVFSGEQGINFLKVNREVPDLILMDISMPGMGGVEATRKIKKLFPGIKVIMATIHDGTAELRESILAGASGYLLKDESPATIINAIHDCLAGGAPMSQSMAPKALQLIRNSVASNGEKDNAGLTPREVEILQELATGATYEQAAKTLFISIGTVRKHVQHAYEKLGVHSKLKAVNEARRKGII